MNSNYGKSSSGSLNNFNFDFGLGSNRPKSLNDQKNHQSSSAYSSSTSTQPMPAWQPNKPSWAHQPAPSQPARPGLGGPTSMVGDIFGKSWNSTSSGSGIGIVEKSPNLFGDLVGSALGNKGSGNVPLKESKPAANKSPYSMGNLADSLPKTSNSTMRNSGSWGSNDSFGSSSGGFNKSSDNVNVSVNAGGDNNTINRSANLGGPSMKSLSGGGISGNRDPFGSLVDFASKQSSILNSAAKEKKANVSDDPFGDFQNASKSSTTAFSSSAFGANNNDFIGSNVDSKPNMDDFGMPNMDFATQKQPPVQTSGGDPLDMFFSSSSGGKTTASGGMGAQQFSEVDDWGLDSEFGGSGGNNVDGASTTELEGLPPPPAGVSASAAKSKGMDNQKQGQYADAIKWLSWAILLLENVGDKSSTREVLSCRASCYKEVGEYKKAVADCTEVLEHDNANVSVLVQRALLYESMEKYKLGAEDLRTVLKIDPGNRIAKSTIHRLTKMVD